MQIERHYETLTYKLLYWDRGMMMLHIISLDIEVLIKNPVEARLPILFKPDMATRTKSGLR